MRCTRAVRLHDVGTVVREIGTPSSCVVDGNITDSESILYLVRACMQV